MVYQILVDSRIATIGRVFIAILPLRDVDWLIECAVVLHDCVFRSISSIENIKIKNLIYMGTRISLRTKALWWFSYYAEPPVSSFPV